MMKISQQKIRNNPGVCAVALGSILFALLASQCIDATEIDLPVPVEIGHVKKMNLHQYVVGYGNVTTAVADRDLPSARSLIGAPAEGFVTEILSSPGEEVLQGTPLLRLDDRIQQAALEQAKQAFVFATKEWHRSEQLKEIDGASETQYQQALRDFNLAKQALEIAEIEFDLQTIRAPIDGVVEAISVDTGQSVHFGQTVATVVDPKRRVCEFQIPSAESRRISKNNPVQVWYQNEWIDAGAVTFISPSVDPQNGSNTVRSSLSAEFPLSIGDFCRIRVLSRIDTDSLAVPQTAFIVDFEGQSYVMVIKDDIARKLSVIQTLKEGGWIGVKGEGLSEGLTVATTGAYGLVENTRVEIIQN